MTVWGEPRAQTKRTVEYYADVLNQIGLKAEIKNHPGRGRTSRPSATRKNKPQTGWANWFQDYPHPSDFIDILLNPDNVVGDGQQQLHLQRRATRSSPTRSTTLNRGARADRRGHQALGEVDREIQEKAYWGIYGNRKQTHLLLGADGLRELQG